MMYGWWGGGGGCGGGGGGGGRDRANHKMTARRTLGKRSNPISMLPGAGRVGGAGAGRGWGGCWGADRASSKNNNNNTTVEDSIDGNKRTRKQTKDAEMAKESRSENDTNSLSLKHSQYKREKQID